MKTYMLCSRRGAIDLNSDELMRDDNFVPAITHIDPFNWFGND